MVDERLKNLHGASRRRFLKFTAAAGAALAVDQSNVLNVLNDSAGTAMADEQACTANTNRMISLVAGNGGFAWFQLLFPHTEIAASNNDGFAFHAFGQTTQATDTDKPFTFAPETPWQDLDANKRISAFMAGNNETHTAQPTSAATLGGGISMLAAATSLQNELSSLLPVIGINPFNLGNAPGAPQVTSVGSAGDMVELFNSAASQALLSVPDDAQLYEAYYKAFLGLNKAARRPTFNRQLRITKASANFLGKNLAGLLSATDDDYFRYGITGGTSNNVREIATGMIVAVKAFKLGLTNAVIMPAMRDDPHGAFQNMGSLTSTVSALGKVLNATIEDLMDIPDPACTGKSLADTTVMTIHGDTPKDPRNRNGWPDGTPNNSNWIYVLGAGHLKTGWFGGVRSNGNVDGFDPATGDNVPNGGSGATSAAAGAAVAYAVAQGDMNRVNDFFSGGSIAGIVNEEIL